MHKKTMGTTMTNRVRALMRERTLACAKFTTRTRKTLSETISLSVEKEN